MVVVVGISSGSVGGGGQMGLSAITIVSPSTKVTSVRPPHGFTATISSTGMP